VRLFPAFLIEHRHDGARGAEGNATVKTERSLGPQNLIRSTGNGAIAYADWPDRATFLSSNPRLASARRGVVVEQRMMSPATGQHAVRSLSPTIYNIEGFQVAITASQNLRLRLAQHVNIYFSQNISRRTAEDRHPKHLGLHCQ
jgi:hypothetical protein